MKSNKIITSIFLFFGFGLCEVNGQINLQPSISNPSPGTSVTYSVQWPGGCAPALVNWSWRVLLNNIPISPTSTSKDAATIYWPYTGSASVSFSSVTVSSPGCGYGSFNTNSASLSVSINIPPPPIPVILPATLVSGSCFNANWQSSGATSYRLDLSTDNFATFVNGINNAEVDGALTSISIGNLAAGTYQYRVRAVNSTGNASNNSSVFSFIVVCAGATSTPPSRYIDYSRITDQSSECCGRGTIIEPYIVGGDNTIATLNGYRYNQLYSSPSYEPYNSQPAVVDVTWASFKTGYIKVRVDQNRRINNILCITCYDAVSTLYYYDIYLANCSTCASSGGPLTSNIWTSNDYGCGTEFRLFANFDNKNCQPISYEWNFGDGQTSIQSNPFHAYAIPGRYTVTLKYKSKCNGSLIVTETTVTREVTVTSVLSSKLDFTSQISTCGTTFTAIPIHPDKNCSNVAYEWDFGDGSPKSTLQSPSHSYSRAGSYYASLKLTYSCSGCQKFITYTKKIIAPEQPPIASFERVNNSCTTTFRPVFYLTDPSCTKTYRWDFGDGTTYIDTEPLDTQTLHTYASSGTYSTSLTVDYLCSGSNCNGQVIITKPTIIAAPEAPQVDFTFLNYACETNFASSITHKSAACSTVSYLWNFGDGTTSVDSNPAHLYASAGTYNVSLTLMYQCANACPTGASTTTNKTIILSASPTTTADFTFNNYICATKFLSTDTSSGSTCQSVSYRWDFGDGAISTDKNPIHVYAISGSYNVVLRQLYQCYNGCPAEITVSKQISFIPTPATIENLLIEAETDEKRQVITASAATFSDVWPLPHDDAGLATKGSYLSGSQGVWRNNATYAYDVPRQLSVATNVAKDGTYTLNQFDWGTATYNVVPDWINANTMTQYSPYSYELENQDVLGVYSAALYDYGGHLPSANGVNMRNAEMAFTSFESLDKEPNGTVSLGKPSGNWMLSNVAQPATLTYKVPIAIGHLAVVDASLEELDLVNKVDVSAERYNFKFFFLTSFGKSHNYLQDVNVLCKQAHPTNPKKSIIVLGRAPFESIWSGKITVKRTASPSLAADLDNTVAHSGKSSLKITADKIFRQEMLQLEEGKSYWINTWVSVNNPSMPTPKLADNLGIELTFKNKQGQIASTVSFQPVGTIIEGWQQVKGSFNSPIKNPIIELKFRAGSTGSAWYDDLRLQPEKGNMKAYVYDLNDYRLRAILDEENYASFFYYDAEGNLYLTKKETEKGVKTITENVSYQVER